MWRPLGEIMIISSLRKSYLICSSGEPFFFAFVEEFIEHPLHLQASENVPGKKKG